jgi:hypothetical protein
MTRGRDDREQEGTSEAIRAGPYPDPSRGRFLPVDFRMSSPAWTPCVMPSDESPKARIRFPIRESTYPTLVTVARHGPCGCSEFFFCLDIIFSWRRHRFLLASVPKDLAHDLLSHRVRVTTSSRSRWRSFFPRSSDGHPVEGEASFLRTLGAEQYCGLQLFDLCLGWALTRQ